jgi:peptide deformylase
MFVMRTHPDVIGVFNPLLLDTSEETIILEEGCLSFDMLFIKVKRPKRIRVRFTNPDGQTETRVFDGMTARCFLHELDHLNGITYLQKANKFHIETAKKRRKQIKEENQRIA